MKTSSIVLLFIGILLLILQFIAYKADDFQFPTFYSGFDSVNSVAMNFGQIIGYNLVGFLGLILIIYAIRRK